MVVHPTCNVSGQAVTASTFEVGGNVVVIITLLVNLILQLRTRNEVKQVSETVHTELKSNDGSTLRDATDRIESSLGTTPLLPEDQQFYAANTHEPKGNENVKDS